jgi:hypothetical protein
MEQSKLRVTKFMGAAPAIAICADCGRQFKVPTNHLNRATDAKENLQQQFDRHECRSTPK